MPPKVVKCWGTLKPITLMPPMDSSPPRAPSTSESNYTLLNYKDFKVISSSRDGWSPARIRAAAAERWAFHEAAERAEEEESAAWAKDYEGPEPGATDEDIRIYTEAEGGEHRYWGVQDPDMTMEEFWARNDPDNTRELLADQNSGPLPATATSTSSKSPSPRPHTASSPKRHQKTSAVSLKNRVAKAGIVTPASKKGTQKSLASKIEGNHLDNHGQTRDIANSSIQERTIARYPLEARRPDKAERSQTISGVNSSMSTPPTKETAAKGRPRQIQPGVIDSPPTKNAYPLTSRTEHPPKRKRGRPAKEKHPTNSQDLHRSYVSNGKQKRPQAESKAKVTKAKLKNDRPTAPSFHKMRTRARGPADNSQQF